MGNSNLSYRYFTSQTGDMIEVETDATTSTGVNLRNLLSVVRIRIYTISTRVPDERQAWIPDYDSFSCSCLGCAVLARMLEHITIHILLCATHLSLVISTKHFLQKAPVNVREALANQIVAGARHRAGETWDNNEDRQALIVEHQQVI